ncbi:MAG: hypothetical protein QNJ46_22615 [Leptolyngbyaceae cyanobacterium MO_188.B28]|nr:hypothetical protein [Leptolyngbyaceae cyanobacterium MO_188.B28]
MADQLSVRPALITDFDFDDESDVTVLVPVNYDFASPFKNENIKPFAGIGLGGTTEGEGDIGAIATGGVDYQLTDRLVANGSVNWLLFDDSDAIFTVGLGYRF